MLRPTPYAVDWVQSTNYFNFVQQLTSVKSTQSVIITDNACIKDSQCIRQFDFVQFSSWEPCPLRV